MKRYSTGETFPDLTLHTLDLPEEPVSHILKGLTVFWMMRYAGCPFCQFDIVQLKNAYDRFLSAGAQVFVVLQSDESHLRAFQEEFQAPFEIVCDPQQKIYRALGVLPAEDEQTFQGDHDRLMQKIVLVDGQGYSHGDYEGNELQLPAVFVVDEERKILYAHYAADVLDMPSPEELLELLPGLK